MMVRLIIEKKCLVPEDIAYMHSLNEDISKKNISNQIHLTFDPDEGFHNFIATKAGNRRIQEQFKILQLQMRRYRYLTLIDARRTELTVQEHERVIAALEREDITAAETAIRDHLRITVDRYKSALSRVAVNDWINLIRNINFMQSFQGSNEIREDET